MGVQQLENEKRVQGALNAMKERTQKVDRINTAVNKMKQNSDKNEGQKAVAQESNDKPKTTEKKPTEGNIKIKFVNDQPVVEFTKNQHKDQDLTDPNATLDAPKLSKDKKKNGKK